MAASGLYVSWHANPVVIYAGEDATLNFQILDDFGANVNVNGWTGTVTLRNKEDATDTITASFSITTAAEGKVACSFARATTVTRGGKTYSGELWREGTGTYSFLSMGDVDILKTVHTLS